MALTPDQRRRLYDALRHAFDRESFTQLIEHRCRWPLAELAPDANILPAAVIQVIDWCDANSRIGRLLAEALSERGDDEPLAQVIADSDFWDKSARPRPAGPVPLERPARVEHFTGREQELGKLIADLMPGKVVTLSGPGGIGKSALAAQVIWALAPGDAPPAAFPGGVLFHSFYGRPSVVAAMEHFAISCGEEPNPSPDLAAQRALGGRTALLVLDGAEQADDLDALLDLRGNCGVLATTRVHGGTNVEPLPANEAAGLLRAWAGQWAVRADKDIAHICELVGRLPLAVRLAAAYMASHGCTAAEYLEWLQETPLAALDHGTRQRESVNVLLAKSIGPMGEREQAELGVVGLLALQPLEVEWIAAALDLDLGAARRGLGDLAQASVLQRNPTDGSYTVTHALIHTYARERLAPGAETVTRLAEFIAARVKSLWNADKRDFAALGRLRQHAVGLVEACARRGAWEEVNYLTSALKDYVRAQGTASDRVSVLTHAVAAARQLGLRDIEGARLSSLGLAYTAMGMPRQALDYHREALTISYEMGDQASLGKRFNNMGLAYSSSGQVEEAIVHYERALAIARAIGDRRGEGNWLVNLGGAYQDRQLM